MVTCVSPSASLRRRPLRVDRLVARPGVDDWRTVVIVVRAGLRLLARQRLERETVPQVRTGDPSQPSSKGESRKALTPYDAGRPDCPGPSSHTPRTFVPIGDTVRPMSRPVRMADRAQHSAATSAWEVRLPSGSTRSATCSSSTCAVITCGYPAGCHVHTIARSSASVAVRRSHRIGVPRPMAS